jgi:hypothetical protein
LIDTTVGIEVFKPSDEERLQLLEGCECNFHIWVGSFEVGEKVKLQPKRNRNIKNVSEVGRQFPVGHKKFQTRNYPSENVKS